MHPGGVGGVVLDGAEHLEGVKALLQAAPEALRDRGRDVALAPAEQLQLVLGVEQVLGILVRRPTASPMTWKILRANSRSITVSTAWPATKVTSLDRVQLAELSLVAGQQALGARACISTVLSPSKVVNTSVSAFSAAKRLTLM